MEVHNLLRKQYEGVGTAHLFGELFGGNYDGIETKEYKVIQTEVKYSPNPLIYLFDIFIDSKIIPT